MGRETVIGDCRLIQGDCLEMMKVLEDACIDCVVTSPPYWGLRDYGVDGQLGLEGTLQEHLEKMVAVFEEIKRILKLNGVVFVNYGDCYATTPNGRSAAASKSAGKDDRTFRDKPLTSKGMLHKKGRVVAGGYLKPKDLCMIPNRFAIAMQDAGWWVRSEIIWAKPNPMPESVTDRPAVAHEKIFMFTKASKYFWDGDGVRQNMQQSSIERLSQDISSQSGSNRANGGAKTNGPMKAVRRQDRQRGHSCRHAGLNDRWDKMSKTEQQANGRNLRNYEPAPVEVWRIATKPFSEAHFATFPPELAERCILAGCPQDGVVLDPFGGAATTGLVASRLRRKSIMLELNPDYIEIAKKRLSGDLLPLFEDSKQARMVQGELL